MALVDYRAEITKSVRESVEVKTRVLETMMDEIALASEWVTNSFKEGGKVLLVGNGGSAADAQHIAAEFIGRFERERRAWPAIALTTDTSILTALSNDYSVETIFSRQIEALGKPGDVLIAFTTSGNSPNVIEGVRKANELGLRTIGFTGEAGGKLAEVCHLTLKVPSRRTCRIQEAHITLCHALCEVVETALSGA